MGNFTVINDPETFAFIQDLYKKEVIEFLEDSRMALVNRKYFDQLILVGNNLYLDFWNVAKEKYAVTFVAGVKQKYETYR